MPKPELRPIAPDELNLLALGILKADRFPHLATMDGDQPRVRPVSPVRTEGFTVYVANLRRYHNGPWSITKFRSRPAHEQGTPPE